MSGPRTSWNADDSLRTAAEPSPDGLRLYLRAALPADALLELSTDREGGGPFTVALISRVLESGQMPTRTELEGDRGPGDRNDALEFCSLVRWGDECAPLQCLAAWLLLTLCADPVDDGRFDVGHETVWSLVDAAASDSVECCVRAIAYLRWHLLERNDSGPTVFHELGMACLYAAIFHAHPAPTSRETLDTQCRRAVEVGDRETLVAIGEGQIGWLNWPLDLTASHAGYRWRELCNSLLVPRGATETPKSARDILSRLNAKADPSF